MLWGNARLLVGLVTAAQQFHDEELLASARRLGDFYVNTADQLCSPAREADYRSSGTYGDGYTCCYFPAIEGLAMLYRATKDDRYLKHAERMAEFFTKFDCLPVEHSHGNLCAWRGILDLYEITGNRTYLDRAKAKWDAAMKGGFVWPLGGVGEHWYVFFPGDEGCSESDWLRFNLDLWRFTGQTRYLDVAERLLENQYATNQCPNGGYGMAHLDGDSAGPVAAIEKIEEWPFCCSFHGPLGLHFLKGYLAAGCERGVIVNFPYDFIAPVKAAGREWSVSVRSKPDYVRGHTRMEIELAPRDKAAVARGTLWVRIPEWASGAKVVAGAGDPVPAPAEGGYLRIQRDFKAGDKLTVDFQNTLVLEGRTVPEGASRSGTSLAREGRGRARRPGPPFRHAREDRRAAGPSGNARCGRPAELPRERRRATRDGRPARHRRHRRADCPGHPICAAGLPADVARNRCIPARRPRVHFGRGDERYGQRGQREAAASALHVRSRRRACGLAGLGPRQAGRPRQGSGKRVGGADLRREPRKTARNLVEQTAGSSPPGAARLRWRHRPDRRRGLRRLSLRVRVDRARGRPRDHRLGRPGKGRGPCFPAAITRRSASVA